MELPRLLAEYEDSGKRFAVHDEGWAGRPPGKGTCARAIAGATGQWQVEILPGTVRFSDPKTQRVLVFREVEGRQGR